MVFLAVTVKRRVLTLSKTILAVRPSVVKRSMESVGKVRQEAEEYDEAVVLPCLAVLCRNGLQIGGGRKAGKREMEM